MELLLIILALCAPIIVFGVTVYLTIIDKENGNGS
jgi:hypothetical protein